MKRGDARRAFRLGTIVVALLAAGLGATSAQEPGRPSAPPRAADAASPGPCSGDSFADGENLSRLVANANSRPTEHAIILQPGCVYTIRDTLVVRARLDGSGRGLPLSINGYGSTVERRPPSSDPERPSDVRPATFRIFDVEPGAVLNLTGVEIRGGRAGADDGGGGGIRVSTGAYVRLAEVVLTRNSSPGPGGALAVYGDAEVTDSAISGNVSGVGGSIVENATRLRLAATTVSGNRGDGGAAVRNTGFAEVVRSTLAANHGFARVIENTAQLRMGASTVAANQGAGLLDRSDAAVFSSLIVGNGGPSCAGDRISFERSLSSDASCNDVISSVRLGSLRTNGGATRTMALRHQSSGVNPGPCALGTGFAASDLAFDQRGVERDSACDIGAFERVDADDDGYDDLTEVG